MTSSVSYSAHSQLSLPGLCKVTDSVNTLANADAAARGAVYTRREVVDFILDLVGYSRDIFFYERRLLEPSFGGGDFLLPAIERLLSAWAQHKTHRSDPLADLANSVCAVELHRATFEKTKSNVIALLTRHGICDRDAACLAERWLINGDFLLASLPKGFDFVVGNPPYVRQELIPDALLAEYRARYRTVYDRADLYIPFIERSLSALKRGGRLGFICADRWMKNRYGGPLRRMVSENFHLKVFVDMVDTPAFHSEVIAYPAITIISREKPGPTRVARRPAIDPISLASLSSQLLLTTPPKPEASFLEIDNVTSGESPWILESFDALAIVRRLEASFPSLEDSGCKVGIGVATGADKAFIGPYDALDVEPDRKLPLVTTRDIVTGSVQWRGLGVINPFNDEGGLVDLDKRPRLRQYLNTHKDLIMRRHVAKKSPQNWYRTIDRITPALASQPKLLIPDIKGGAHIVYEDGRLYPHHNLYYITSSAWDLKALQALLMSGVARLFISTYSTKMRGGYLRFQAQYLRRIRIPQWSDVPKNIQRDLVAASEAKDVAACNQTVFALYGLSPDERLILEGIHINGH